MPKGSRQAAHRHSPMQRRRQAHHRTAASASSKSGSIDTSKEETEDPVAAATGDETISRISLHQEWRMLISGRQF